MGRRFGSPHFFPSLLDRPPPRRRNPNPHYLNRLPVSDHHLALSCREPAPNKAREHCPAEAEATGEHLLVDAMRAAGQQLQSPALLRAEATFSRGFSQQELQPIIFPVSPPHNALAKAAFASPSVSAIP